MILESYANLDAALGRAEATPVAHPWAALGHALRNWAIEAPHEFQLIYGTPVPGYVAPPETIPAAAAVADRFLLLGATEEVEAFLEPPVLAQMRALVAARPQVKASGAAAVLTELAALVGFVGLELSVHFVGTAEPADGLYAALLNRQVFSLRLGAGS